MSGPFLSEGYAVPLFAAFRPSFADLRLIYSRHQVLMVVVFSSRIRSFLYRKSLSWVMVLGVYQSLQARAEIAT